VSEINVAQPALSQGSATLPRIGQLLGYARVSTTDQHPPFQVDALERAGCYRVFTETASGARRTDRPTLEQVLDQLRPGDTLVVWNSTPRPLPAAPGRHHHRLAERGIGFRSLQEAIDTTTPAASLCSTCSPPWPNSNAT
jgi:hypothetical protein